MRKLCESFCRFSVTNATTSLNAIELFESGRIGGLTPMASISMDNSHSERESRELHLAVNIGPIQCTPSKVPLDRKQCQEIIFFVESVP